MGHPSICGGERVGNNIIMPFGSCQRTDRFTPQQQHNTHSIGCIMGELITKDAILQGEGELDQIDRIFKLVGVPTNENWPGFDKLPSAGLFRWKSMKGDFQLGQRFPVGSPVGGQTFLDSNGFDLLQQLLTLDPKKRMSATSALQHAYFSEGVERQVPKFLFGS